MKRRLARICAAVGLPLCDASPHSAAVRPALWRRGNSRRPRGPPRARNPAGPAAREPRLAACGLLKRHGCARAQKNRMRRICYLALKESQFVRRRAGGQTTRTELEERSVRCGAAGHRPWGAGRQRVRLAGRPGAPSDGRVLAGFFAPPSLAQGGCGQCDSFCIKHLNKNLRYKISSSLIKKLEGKTHTYRIHTLLP